MTIVAYDAAVDDSGNNEGDVFLYLHAISAQSSIPLTCSWGADTAASQRMGLLQPEADTASFRFKRVTSCG